MKTFKLYLTFAVMLLPLCSWAQVKLFDKYSDMKDVKSIYISKTMLDMGPHLFTDLYLGSATKKLNSVRLLSTSSAGVYKKMFEDIRSMLKSSNYGLLMKQKGTNSSAEFYVGKQGNRITELIMLMYKPESVLKFIYLEGNMTETDVKNILLYQNSSSTAMPCQLPDLNGLEHLNDLIALKDLEGLQDLSGLKDLEKYMDEDTWKEFNEQMEELQKHLKNGDKKISRN